MGTAASVLTVTAGAQVHRAMMELLHLPLQQMQIAENLDHTPARV